MTDKIIVRLVPNNEIREFHVTRELSEDPAKAFFRPLRPSSKKFLKVVGPIGTQVVTKCLSIPGVTEVIIKPYSLQVMKGEAFDWEGIQGQVIAVLQETFENPNGVAIFPPIQPH